ncbi:unnamed protein product [Phaeothamnion confervicola]
MQGTEAHAILGGNPGFVCELSMGTGSRRLLVSATAGSMKRAKAAASVLLLQRAAELWNEQNPEDRIDMADMEQPTEGPGAAATMPRADDGDGGGGGSGGGSSGRAEKTIKHLRAQMGEEFCRWAEAWVELVRGGEAQQANFPPVLSPAQRSFVHALIDPFPDLSSCSSLSATRRRAVSVMLRSITYGAPAAHGAGPGVVTIDVPAPFKMPSDVSLDKIRRIIDYGSLARELVAEVQGKKLPAGAAAAAAAPPTAPAAAAAYAAASIDTSTGETLVGSTSSVVATAEVASAEAAAAAAAKGATGGGSGNGSMV